MLLGINKEVEDFDSVDDPNAQITNVIWIKNEGYAYFNPTYEKDDLSVCEYLYLIISYEGSYCIWKTSAFVFNISL